MAAEISALHRRNELHFKVYSIDNRFLNSNNFVDFTVFFYQINAAETYFKNIKHRTGL